MIKPISKNIIPELLGIALVSSMCVALRLPMGERIVSPAVVITIFVMLLLAIIGSLSGFRSPVIRIKPALIVAWYTLVILSGVMTYSNNLRVPYGQHILSLVLEYLIYLFLFFLVFVGFGHRSMNKEIYVGLIIGILLNVIWAYIELISWKAFRVAISTLLFGRLFNIGRNWTILLNGNEIRVSGLNWDPAFLGILLAASLAWVVRDCRGTRRIFFAVILAIIFFFSGSRTGMVACVATVFLDYLITGRKTWNSIVSNIAILIALFILVAITVNLVSSASVNSPYLNRLNVFNSNGISISSFRRIEYYKKAPYLLVRSGNPLTILFGYGPGMAGKAINDAPEISQLLRMESLRGLSWEPESTIVSVLLNFGVIGLCVFGMMQLSLVSMTLELSKADRRYRLAYFMSVVYIFGGIFYRFHFTLMFELLAIFISSDYSRMKNSLIPGRICCCDRESTLALESRGLP